MLDKAKLRLLEKLDDWDQLEFVSSSEGANQKKQQLLEMARNGEPRPIQKKHLLGSVLNAYINPRHGCYDFEFDKQIHKLRPDWFVDSAVEKKQQILEMAHNGESIPMQKKHPLGRVLNTYINPKSGCYDLEFDKQIRKLRPDWFIKKSDSAKQQLFEIARNSEPKPSYSKHPLGQVLYYCTNPKSGCYDLEFDKQIRKLRPDWFVTQFDKSNEKKQQLLEMARNGEPRPIQKKHLLGSVLNTYINPKSGCYDLEFDKQIRKLRPDWFIKKSDSAKQQLFEMARNRESRPVGEKHILGRVLQHYTNPKSDCYDAEFDKEIRTLRPDWFKKPLQ